MNTEELKKKLALEIKQTIIELNKKIKQANQLNLQVVVVQESGRHDLYSPDVAVSICETTSY